MKLIDKDKVAAEIEKRYEYWREKEFNSHSIESEIRMSECQHLMLLLNNLEVKEEKDFGKKSSDEVLKIRQEVYQSGYNDGYKHGCEDTKKKGE